MELVNWLYQNVVHQLEQVGTVVYDHQMQRNTIERQATSINLTYTAIAELMGAQQLLAKYAREVDEFVHSLKDYIDKEMEDKHHRRIVHFNSFDYEKRFQCISLVQFVPATSDLQSYRMIVYQRSADVVKMKDDWRFFCELAYLFTTRYSFQVDKIVIFYGSLHMTYDKGLRS